MKLWIINFERTVKWRVPGTNSDQDTIRKEVKQEVFRVVCEESAVACALLSTRHREDPAFVIKTFDSLEIDCIIPNVVWH